MGELDIPVTWKDRIDDLIGRRRDGWFVPVLIAAIAISGLVLTGGGAPASIAPPSTSAAPEAVSGRILVHVAGAVRRPGLYELAAGARVADAVRAAGGARRKRQLRELNLARVLVDGEQIVVGEKIQSPPTLPSQPSLVNVNTAEVPGLETIPGIGPSKAAAIIQWRNENGPFTTVEQLLEIPGIGPATLETMRAYITLG